VMEDGVGETLEETDGKGGAGEVHRSVGRVRWGQVRRGKKLRALVQVRWDN
jgi:hypothetical protein